MRGTEEFWAGSFGDDYTDRNTSQKYVASNEVLFRRILGERTAISSVLELGANRGHNLEALRRIYPNLQCQAVEINERAAAECARVIGSNNVVVSPIRTARSSLRPAELVLLKGVLIHIQPEDLAQVYELAASFASRWLLICEYYNPTPVEVPYRGHEGRLFKRDFAGEILDRFPTVKLADYGFAYHRDAIAPQDDLTWFLMETSE